MSNNLSENAVRPIVMGRKNWLFSDTQDGANASMVIYSLIETTKANDIDPEKYLEYLLESRLSADLSEVELGQLAPWSKSTRKTCAITLE